MDVKYDPLPHTQVQDRDDWRSMTVVANIFTEL